MASNSPKRPSQRKLILVLASVVALGALLWMKFGVPQQAPSFADWLEVTDVAYGNPSLNEVQSVSSEALHVNGIQRSMQGPYNISKVKLRPETAPELVWLTGYSSAIAKENGDPVSDGFMCHNNLNIVDKNTSPWAIKTHGSNIRLFTLTEGQTALEMPEGFGIPLHPNQELEVVAQVLNHNEVNADFKAIHNTQINYQTLSNESKPMVPLYQQAVFITKQTEGPVGEYGSHLMCNAYEIDETSSVGSAPKSADSSVAAPYNPYLDEFGRTYTGHWKLAPGKETLTTDVTPMLNLPFDTKVHYIGAHLHPFGESIHLIDLSTNDTLCTIQAENYPDKIGLKNIGHYSSTEGILLYKTHRYALSCTYNCTDSTQNHTGMATLFLFLEDKE